MGDEPEDVPDYRRYASELPRPTGRCGAGDEHPARSDGGSWPEVAGVRRACKTI